MIRGFCLILIGFTLGCGAKSTLRGSSSSAAVAPPPAPSNPVPTITKTVITCDARKITAVNICRENIGSIYDDPDYIAIATSGCQDQGGSVSQITCDRTESVGYCAVALGQENEIRLNYFAPKFDATSAQANCQQENGIFIQ